MRRAAFTLLELIFVIVIMGILAKFGIELLSQAYKSFIFSSVNNRLQSQSSAAVETIASRLQYRIKDSVIAREADDDFFGLAGYSDDNATILEWVATDIDGFRGNTAVLPHWSGIIDLDLSSSSVLVSPGTDTGELNTIIGVLSPSATTINNAAIYFVGSDSDIYTGYGWGGAITTQDVAMHPIRSNGIANQFVPTNGATGADNNLSGVNVYEYYQLAWTAYAVGIDDYDDTTGTGTLKLWYDYQPWNGDTYLVKADGTETKSAVIMDDVSTFRFRAAGSIVKIQVCVNSDLMEDYSLCKEKTIF
ncbi:MAG: prepilin-type N-terminal cleavage/methylation domain-containing protein [Sulfurimonas sp.]|uniref:pilus assembly FimT family protein n=1 Tax=Sulfurimonas sp. TaxID=2022749 RepID=UPI0028CFCB2B|nr:prepilin-type N-terminal cleavage/methylation domain-containing protein [Sulfurimonas sp.]MDT8338669.1 prepilin-type N-terminal cleavage/methylation domain-containing protein [Sulfurimonas sp.]